MPYFPRFAAESSLNDRESRGGEPALIVIDAYNALLFSK